MPRSSNWLLAALLFAALSLAGCARGDAGDSGMPPADSGPGDEAAVDAGHDARDAAMSPDVRNTDVPTAMDTPAPRDVPMFDSGGPVDTGSFCPATCSSDIECQSGCPAPAAGYHYCCQTGSGGGTCSQQTAACPTPTPDAGSGGGPGAVCMSNAQCNMGSANCCLMSGGIGVCGCNMGFGCLPPMFCP
jgi:hypothetical protein